MKKNIIFALFFCLMALWSACSHEGETVKLAVDPDNVSISLNSTEVHKLVITASGDWVITKPDEAGWVNVNPSKGSGITTVTVTALNNMTEDSREAILKVVSSSTKESKEIRVVQQGSRPPANAGNIAGNEANNCPYTVAVDLSVEPIARAVSYKWYCNGQVIATTTEPTYAATQTGAYTVAGVNGNGEGTPSSEKRITVTQCSRPAAAGAVLGVSTNVCPEEQVSLSVAPVNDAVSYQWYKNGSAISGATSITYNVTTSGNYSVAGVNAAGEGLRSAEKAVTIVNCPSLVDDYLGEWDVVFEVEVSGADGKTKNPNYTQGSTTHTITITKVNSATVKIVGLHKTGQDEIFATVNSAKEMIIKSQKLAQSWAADVDTYIVPMKISPPCSNMGQDFAPASIKMIDGKPTIELKGADPGYTTSYNIATYTASYTVVAVSPGTSNCLGYFVYAAGTKWVKKN